ncbi:MAG TPA: multidrug ABC transporter ATP-binding protein [Lachnospiraceae bacterium]|nr:multidrug ABC transporter ATP-binding protein [Lachnospiraceae bacterium]
MPEKEKTQIRIGGGRHPGMAQNVEKPKHAKDAAKRLLSYFGREKWFLIFLFLAVGVATVTQVFAPICQGNAIDAIFDRSTGGLKRLLFTLLALYIVQALSSLAQSLIAALLSQRVTLRMRHDLFLKIDHLPVPYLDTRSSGDIMSRMTSDVENISQTISTSVAAFVSGILQTIGTIVIMFLVSWQMSLVTLISVFASLVATKLLSGVQRRAFRKRSEVLGELDGYAQEMVTGYRTITAFSRQDHVKKQFNDVSDRLTGAGIRAEILGGSTGPIMNCISNAGFVLVALAGGCAALTGLLSIGTVSAFLIWAKQISRPINDIAQLFGTIQTALAGAERVFQLMDEKDENNEGTKIPDPMKGEVKFQDVTFSYTPGHPVLTDFNLTIRPGEKIALVGATGSGKTTVVNLLLRFYFPDSGSISIDGVDIKEMDRSFLRKNTAIVLQDTVLFSDTIAGNIRYGNAGATDEQVQQAAVLANADPFIQLLPKKYQFFLKRAGERLSQGQRQLLTIARAMAADPKILILDEATSSVDTRTEKHVQSAMTNLMENRTSLIIAHRLSTIRDVDRILVLDHGHVTESGTHEELLKKKGTYYDLYMTQFAGKAT